MEEEHFRDDWSNPFYLCCEPTLIEGLKFAKDLIIPNVLLRLLIQFTNVPHNVRHSFSLLLGSFLLYYNVGPAFIWTLSITLGSYILMILFSALLSKRIGLVVSCILIIFILACEFYIVYPKMWQQLRGIQMIATMKIISVIIDFDRGIYKQMLNPVEYGGYVLCPANCFMGPWISFKSYNNYLNVKYLSRQWITLIIYYLLLSLFFLLMSNCIVPLYFYDDANRWLVAYRDAQAFRMSHYFVSSLSVVSMISAGIGMTNNGQSEVEITKPVSIELPRSLVQVVVCWNIPMHLWLKTYVFKTFRPYGQFIAILITYIISSILHGINFQLSAVLLSIGTFSYVEYNFRAKVSYILEACCLANHCNKNCNHKYKSTSSLAKCINLLFSLMTVIHLAYLGVMFEASFAVQETGYSYLHTLNKWRNLSYFSHGFMLFLYLLNLII